ncbi:hypothetical protein UPYG_G00110040 [Umbra pygmaea]|uniref:Uncharacterized protein n=1 Tax=Umbra pygmaea TaxID=75934 RepID=A0ABD0XN08_UMBPY
MKPYALAGGASRRTMSHYRCHLFNWYDDDDNNKLESEDEELETVQSNMETDARLQNQPAHPGEEEDWEVEITNSELAYDPEELLSPGGQPSHPSDVPSLRPVQTPYSYNPSIHHTTPVLWRCQRDPAAVPDTSTSDQFEDAEEK